MPRVEVVCLANSRKIGGRCVAGLQTDNRGWIRPVSDLANGSLTQRHYTLDNGKPASLLDVIRIPVAAPQPEVSQPENWILTNETWEFVRNLAPREASRVLEQALVTGPDLLGNQSDRIALANFTQHPASASLALIEPHCLKWEITTNMKGYRQTRALFDLGGCHYDLVVTDPDWHSRLGELTLGVYSQERCGLGPGDRIFLTISLGQPFGDHCFKLVAGVIVLPSAAD